VCPWTTAGAAAARIKHLVNTWPRASGGRLNNGARNGEGWQSDDAMTWTGRDRYDARIWRGLRLNGIPIRKMGPCSRERDFTVCFRMEAL
jgi:hypothetical protein